jgi:hypothetical protein
VAAVLAACGKAKSTVQNRSARAPRRDTLPAAPPSLETARAVNTIVLDYRSRLEDVIDRGTTPRPASGNGS